MQVIHGRSGFRAWMLSKVGHVYLQSPYSYLLPVSWMWTIRPARRSWNLCTRFWIEHGAYLVAHIAWIQCFFFKSIYLLNAVQFKPRRFVYLSLDSTNLRWTTIWMPVRGVFAIWLWATVVASARARTACNLHCAFPGSWRQRRVSILQAQPLGIGCRVSFWHSTTITASQPSIDSMRTNKRWCSTWFPGHVQTLWWPISSKDCFLFEHIFLFLNACFSGLCDTQKWIKNMSHTTQGSPACYAAPYRPCEVGAVRFLHRSTPWSEVDAGGLSKVWMSSSFEEGIDSHRGIASTPFPIGDPLLHWGWEKASPIIQATGALVIPILWCSLWSGMHVPGGLGWGAWIEQLDRWEREDFVEGFLPKVAHIAFSLAFSTLKYFHICSIKVRFRDFLC